MSDMSGATPPPRKGMTAGRIALLIVGSLIALIGLGLTAAGGGLLIVNQTLRDSEGFFTTSTQRFATSGRAVATESLSVLGGLPLELADDNLATVRIRATAADPTSTVFVGIARASDVDRYLAGVNHDRITNIDYNPFHVDYEPRVGTRIPQRPASQSVWVASATGPGTQTVRWSVTGGTWSVVVMNADATPGVQVDANLGAKIKHLSGIAIGLLVGGLVLLGAAVSMIYFGARRPRGPGAPPGAEADRYAATTTRSATPASPVLLEGHLDEDRSRWLWLVKWLLAIPHWIVLCFLWLALWVLSIVAFFAILFTGRYPRGIFDFNVGVLRWTWRVEFYAYSALGTDRYPPFTLADDPDYPARFDVAYPERLSRGLVLVKSWLLAIPHYIIVAVFTGAWWFGAPGAWSFADGDGWWWWQGMPGLIGALVLIAALAMLFTGRYPRGIFDLVMGLNRWAYRVFAYAGLMRDEYPPFRLDMGEREPDGPGGDGSDATAETSRMPY